MTELTHKDVEVLEYAAKKRLIRPEDYPGKRNEAFRLLIRALRGEING